MVSKNKYSSILCFRSVVDGYTFFLSSVNTELKETVCIDMQGGHGDSPGDGTAGVWPQPPPTV